MDWVKANQHDRVRAADGGERVGGDFVRKSSSCAHRWSEWRNVGVSDQTWSRQCALCKLSQKRPTAPSRRVNASNGPPLPRVVRTKGPLIERHADGTIREVDQREATQAAREELAKNREPRPTVATRARSAAAMATNEAELPFDDATKRAIGTTVPRPPGVSRRGWAVIGRSDIQCPRCDATVSVIARTSPNQEVVLCPGCRSARPLADHDGATVRLLRDSVARYGRAKHGRGMTSEPNPTKTP